MSHNFEPQSINDFVYKSSKEQQLVQSIADGRRPFPQSGKNGIVLYGAYGTGKSALSKILPAAIETGKGHDLEIYDYFQIQAGGKNGTDVIGIIDKRSDLMSANGSEFHYFVLDEVDELTPTAMSSLKAVMNKTKTLFVMTTNNLHKIDRGVQSRSHCIEFNAVPSVAWLPLAHRILSAYGVDSPNIDALLIDVIDDCAGCARDIVDACIEIALIRQMKKAA